MVSWEEAGGGWRGAEGDDGAEAREGGREGAKRPL